MILDRVHQPAVLGTETFDLPSYTEIPLSNGQMLHALPSNEVEMMRLDLQFPAGRWQEDHALVAGFTAAMMREGTLKRKAAEIAETLDFYGSSLSINSRSEYLNIQLMCLRRYAAQVLPLVFEILTEPSFPEGELKTRKLNSLQKLKVNELKSDYVASESFSEALFGPAHPYGYRTTVERIKAVDVDQLRAHHAKHIGPGTMRVFLTGAYDDSFIQLLDRTLGSKDWGASVSIDRKSWQKVAPKPSLIRINKDAAQQASIRMGGVCINKLHPDYNRMRIMNIIFGGYFGSRLMSNIREEKGYTYGIYSSMVSLMDTGYTMIGTEIGNDYVEDTLKEIRHEADRLKQDPVPDEELEMVRNYILGNMASHADGVFKQSNVLKELLIYGQGNEDHRAYMDLIRTIDKKAIQDMAQKYLDLDQMVGIVVHG